MARRNMRLAAPISKSILVAVSAITVILSLRSLSLLANNADVLDLSTSLEHRLPLPDADYFARFVRSHSLDSSSTDCGDSFTRANLTVNLAAFQAAAKQNDASLLDIANRNAVRAASHRLTCNPLDGNAWLRLAMVNAEGARPRAEVISPLRLSYRWAPSEAWVIEPRLAFATNLSLAGATGFELEYLADLRRFASFEATGQVAATYVETPALVRAQLRPLIILEPDARKKAIIAEIERQDVDFAGE